MKAMKKSRSNQEELLAHSAKNKCEQQFKKLMAKYARKKLMVKELLNTNMKLQEKFIQMIQYINELKKNRKIAESVFENNVSYLIAALAQNQAPMFEQKQSAQQVLPPRAPNAILHSSSTLQVQPNTYVCPYQFPLIIIPNQSGGRCLFCGQCPGYHNNILTAMYFMDCFDEC